MGGIHVGPGPLVVLALVWGVAALAVRAALRRGTRGTQVVGTVVGYVERPTPGGTTSAVVFAAVVNGAEVRGAFDVRFKDWPIGAKVPARYHAGALIPVDLEAAPSQWVPVILFLATVVSGVSVVPWILLDSPGCLAPAPGRAVPAVPAPEAPPATGGASVPAEAVPAEAVPAESVQAEAVPAASVPAEATPAASVPAEAVPAEPASPGARARRAALEAAFRRSQPAARRCLDEALRRDPALATDVRVGMIVTPAGKATDVVVEHATVAAPALEACLVGAVRALSLPPGEAAAPFTWTFALRAAP